MAANRADGLFFAGDLGQPIFQQPFSWRSLGVDVRGQSLTSRINYRTSHQIRLQADRLLPPALVDVDDNEEDRRGTVSVFNGPAPTIEIFNGPKQEAEAIGAWIGVRIEQGIEPHEIGVFVRSNRELRRARNAVKRASIQALELGDRVEITPGELSLGRTHVAKGVEFQLIAVVTCQSLLRIPGDLTAKGGAPENVIGTGLRARRSRAALPRRYGAAQVGLRPEPSCGPLDGRSRCRMPDRGWAERYPGEERRTGKGIDIER